LKKVILFVLAFVVLIPAMAEGADQRQVLLLNEMQRDHLLGEMRLLLTGTGAILEALSQGDMTAVVRHARSLGMDMPHKMEGHMEHVMPEQFMRMGMAVHQAFDKIAQDAESGKDTTHILQQLSSALGRCTACHAIYQVSTTQSSAEQKPHAGHSHAQ